MIGIDGSDRDSMEEEKAFRLTYSTSFTFFYSSLFFLSFSPSFFLFSFPFFEYFLCKCIKISKEFTCNEDMKESFFLKRVYKNVKQNLKGYVHVRGM